MNSSGEIVIKLKNVSFTYKSADTPTIKNINLEVKQGEFVGLVGPTGSGKTTLLNLIAGVLPHYYEGTLEGEVSILGKPTTEMSMAELSKLVGLVMQDPESQLFNLYVRDEVIWGLENLGVPREKIAEERIRVADFFRIGELLDRITYDLSGGEKQKVAIASTYIMMPEIFIFDNPTSQLDPLGSSMIFEAINNLAKEEGTTVIVFEDKVEELAAFADRLWLINNGEIFLDDEPREFFIQKDILNDALIRVPSVSAVGYELLNKGIHIEEIPLTIDEAINTYRNLINTHEGT
jgi:energy-coupling factor transport system ATP-binding protein